MYCNQIFSLMSKQTLGYKIENIIVADNYETANILARNIYGTDAIAEDTTLYPVSIGDDYISGAYCRGESVINRNPTEAENIVLLEQKNKELQAVIDVLVVSSLEV